MNILEFKELTIDDKPLFDKMFKKDPPNISEYTFANLFIWRNSRKIEYAEYEEGLIVFATLGKDKYFLPPIGYEDPKKAISKIIEFNKENKMAEYIKRVDNSMIEQIEDMKLEAIEDRDNYDYVYRADDLAFLKGRRYSNKRGFIKKFFSEYYHRYDKYTDNHKFDVLRIADDWLKNRKPDHPTMKHENDAIKELVNNYDKLNAIGGIICIEHNFVAFTFGEKLNNDTFVVHFEKADPDYVGVYPAINKLFAENEVENEYEFINREQDLGIEGMRKAKKSYSPIEMIEKYNVKIL